MLSTDRPPITIPVLQQRVREGQRLVMTTAYDAVTARLADPIVDMILVGDSVGNVCLGFDNTLPVSMAMMNHHLEAVMRTRPRALVVADMPYLSYHLSLEDTLRNAGGFLQRGASAVKLEGGANRAEIIRALVDCEIPVMGHLGLTPQSVHAMGGFKVQGRGAAGRHPDPGGRASAPGGGLLCPRARGHPVRAGGADHPDASAFRPSASGPGRIARVRCWSCMTCSG